MKLSNGKLGKMGKKVWKGRYRQAREAKPCGTPGGHGVIKQRSVTASQTWESESGLGTHETPYFVPPGPVPVQTPTPRKLQAAKPASYKTDADKGQGTTSLGGEQQGSIKVPAGITCTLRGACVPSQCTFSVPVGGRLGRFSVQSIAQHSHSQSQYIASGSCAVSEPPAPRLKRLRSQVMGRKWRNTQIAATRVTPRELPGISTIFATKSIIV